LCCVPYLVSCLGGGFDGGASGMAQPMLRGQALNIFLGEPSLDCFLVSLVLGVVLGLTTGYERLVYSTSDWVSWGFTRAVQCVQVLVRLERRYLTIDHTPQQSAGLRVGRFRKTGCLFELVRDGSWGSAIRPYCRVIIEWAW
jgi:hypothetical protein